MNCYAHKCTKKGEKFDVAFCMYACPEHADMWRKQMKALDVAFLHDTDHRCQTKYCRYPGEYHKYFYYGRSNYFDHMYRCYFHASVGYEKCYVQANEVIKIVVTLCKTCGKRTALRTDETECGNCIDASVSLDADYLPEQRVWIKS